MDEKRVQENLEEHEQIVKALEARDANLAEDWSKKTYSIGLCISN
jgi:DNA-binding GntR family transcriptional regulator